MVQVSVNLNSRTSDVRDSINRFASREIETNNNLMRGIGFTLMGLNVLRVIFGIESKGRIEALVDEYGAMQRRDSGSGALRVPKNGPIAAT